MERVNLADVGKQMTAIGDRAAAGDDTAIARNGKAATREIPPKVRVDITMLDELHRKMPLQTKSAGEFIRRMRDDGY